MPWLQHVALGLAYQPNAILVTSSYSIGLTFQLTATPVFISFNIRFQDTDIITSGASKKDNSLPCKNIEVPFSLEKMSAKYVNFYSHSTVFQFTG